MTEAIESSGAKRGRRRGIAPRCRMLAVAALALIAAGCATPPPPPPEPAPPPPVAPLPPPPMACPTCDEQNRELARLRQDLLVRDAELRDLRAQQRDQVKALQESARQAVRAKVKLRRLASQANAASYIAEVEVALEAVRAAPGAAAKSGLIAMPQALLEAASAQFTQGDYATAMDRAAQAEELIAMLAGSSPRTAADARSRAETPFDIAIPMRVRIDSHLRRQPNGKAGILGVVPAAAPVVAMAYRGNWLRIEADGGRTGWIYQTLVVLR